jgi:Nif-specific regulatory protein
METALGLCARILGESTLDSEAYIAYTDAKTHTMKVVAWYPENSHKILHGKEIRLGIHPCGLAIEHEALSRGTLKDARHFIEAPYWNEKKIIGAVGIIINSTTSRQDFVRLEELIQWSAYSIEESLDMRTALLRKAQGAGLVFDSGSRPPVDATSQEDLSFHGILGSSSGMKDVFTLISQVAGTSATVLLTGESGTGKELAAKAIHECSDRSRGPFVAVNCSALPESIIESELFGHEKGAFTGAIATRIGRFEAANDGTLFLDEIGELSPSIQVKLLRILQERSFERVGGSKAVKTNARIIVATNRDLQEAVRQGSFREDLFFRLNVFPIHLPPLRDRGADILLLADYFAEKYSVETGKSIKRISSPALDLLMLYHWPGNVRELENCMSRAVIVSTDGVIHSYNLPPSLQSASSTGTEPISTFDGAIARLEKELLVEALKIERGNSVLAAHRLGVTERRFRFALQKYKLDYKSYRTKV